MLYCHYDWARSLLSAGLNISKQKLRLISVAWVVRSSVRTRSEKTLDWTGIFDCFHFWLIYLWLCGDVLVPAYWWLMLARVHQSDLPGMACCQLLAPTLSSGQIMTRTEYLSAPGFTFKLELTCLSSQSSLHHQRDGVMQRKIEYFQTEEGERWVASF